MSQWHRAGWREHHARHRCFSLTPPSSPSSFIFYFFVERCSASRLLYLPQPRGLILANKFVAPQEGQATLSFAARGNVCDSPFPLRPRTGLQTKRHVPTIIAVVLYTFGASLPSDHVQHISINIAGLTPPPPHFIRICRSLQVFPTSES